MGPGEVAGAAPKGKCENSQAKGSDPDETPERKGKTALDAEGATAAGRESLRLKTEAQGT